MADPIPSFPLYSVTWQDLGRAQAVLSEAFAEDPFFAYALGGPDAVRAETLHGFTLRFGLRYGRVFAPSPALEGVAVWLPPGSTEMTALRSLRAGVLSVGRISFASMTQRRRFFLRLMRYGAYSGSLHKRHAPFAHWYLLNVGIRRAYRGQGYAGRLLRPVLQYLDRAGISCYLETHNPANPALYEHFGFRVVEVGRLPGTDQPHWSMLRLPTSDEFRHPAARDT